MSIGLMNLLALLLVLGLLLGLVHRLLPMPGIIHHLLSLVVFMVMVIYVLQYLGFVSGVLPPINLLRAISKG